MSRPIFTTDMSDLDGQTNSATPVKANLQDLETAATVLDWENITRESIDADHVETSNPLTVGDSAGSISATYNATINTDQVLQSVTFSCEVGAVVWLIGRLQGHVAQPRGTDTIIRLKDGASVLRSQNIGNNPSDGGGGGIFYSLEATATSYTITFVVNRPTSPLALLDYRLHHMVFNR